MADGPVLTDPQRRALEALVRLADVPVGTAQVPQTWVSPWQIARTLWPDSPAWNRATRRPGDAGAGAVGGTMPMKAGTILHRLGKMGLAARKGGRIDANCWTPTSRGRAAVRNEAAPDTP